MPAKVVAFINFKGGVGKTSNVVNLGAALAKLHRKRVLIVDLDPQANSTFWLLRMSDWEKLNRDRSRTVAQVFQDAIDRTELFDFERCVVRGVPWSEKGFSHIQDLDLLPASVDLLETEEDLYKVQEHEAFFMVLHHRLKACRAHYDYILLDCPPNVYGVAKNALFFADHYLVPYIPDYLSLSGLRTFARLIRRFQDSIAPFYVGELGPRLSAVIVNRYKKRGKVFDEAINELKLELGDLRKAGLVHEKACVLEPPVRDCVSLAECTNLHLPVIIHRDDALSAVDYGLLAEAFTWHLGHTMF